MEKCLFRFALIASLISLGLAQEEAFCHLPSCKDAPHTLCIYPFLKPSPACGKIISSGLTQKEVDGIVALHNKLRKKVASGQEKRGHPGPQPGAKHMPDLTWSNDLTAVAQTWALQCINKHDACKNLPQYYVGQNLNWGSAGGPYDIPLSMLVQVWYDEVKHVNPKIVKKYHLKKEYAHYTQMVWAKTTEIGCGLVRYTRNNGEDYEIFLVCNYGPGGNVDTEPMYEVK
ncbi:venom allergen 5-like [Venturia canescens]|uniref:venom allergen 5-like n=1 Tax=Venturia canescens TaxID=32260 RepID=UPI001C9CBF3D|nr:venom allergen 5-like [Venturia canescens]